MNSFLDENMSKRPSDIYTEFQHSISILFRTYTYMPLRDRNPIGKGLIENKSRVGQHHVPGMPMSEDLVRFLHEYLHSIYK